MWRIILLYGAISMPAILMVAVAVKEFARSRAGQDRPLRLS
jgi:hypothetical protein